MTYRWLLLFLAISLSCLGIAQTPADSLHAQPNYLRFQPQALILPAAMITYGALGIKNDPIDAWDEELRNSLNPEGTRTRIDDLTRFAPIAAVYGLNLAGIEGRHRFKDRTIILGTATALMFGSVKIIKNNAAVRRPDGRSLTSFPSGHTATAFMAAEFLHQEYGHLSAWYSVAGYTVAAGTGFLRLYNDKHWLTDVVAGAGIGMLTMKLAYWVYPTFKKLFKQKSEKDNTFETTVLPVYDGQDWRISVNTRF